METWDTMLDSRSRSWSDTTFGHALGTELDAKSPYESVILLDEAFALESVLQWDNRSGTELPTMEHRNRFDCFPFPHDGILELAVHPCFFDSKSSQERTDSKLSR